MVTQSPKQHHKLDQTLPRTGHRRQLLKHSVFRWHYLDLLLLMALTIFAWYSYHAFIDHNHYQWQWQRTLELIFSTQADHPTPYLLQGLIVTIRLSLWSMVLACILGTLLGVAQCSALALFRLPATLYVRVMRSLPPLVFLFVFYFFISNQLIPLLGLTDILRDHSAPLSWWQGLLFGPATLWENLLSGVLCISLLSAAYIAEIVRSGIIGVAAGQREAGSSLGLSSWQQMRLIIAPQVLPAIAPALTGQLLNTLKDSSIVSVISIQELTFTATEMANSSGFIFEIWIIVGGCYFILGLCLSSLLNRIQPHP